MQRKSDLDRVVEKLWESPSFRGSVAKDGGAALSDEQRILIEATSPELIATMRTVLTSASDDDLDAFLGNHAAATVAELLIDALSPAARATFFASMRAKYPEAGPAGVA